MEAVQIPSEPIQQLPPSPPRHIMAQQAPLVKRLIEAAVFPKKKTAYSAGYDLSSAVDAVVPANGKALYRQILLLRYLMGRTAVLLHEVASHPNIISQSAGVINADYLGRVKVIMFNHGNVDFHVFNGHRIAQFLLERIAPPRGSIRLSVRHHPWNSRGFESY